MIDWKRITELKEDFGEDGFEELLPVFTAEIQEALERLNSETTTSAVAEICHFIKGSAANLGLSQLTELCATNERAARDGQIDANLMQVLTASFTASISELEKGP